MAELQFTFLESIRRGNISVSVFLVNGIKLQGYLESFDNDVVVLRNSGNQMIFRHAISTIVPARQITLSDDCKAYLID
jgi:host factor-I protein